MHHHILYYHIHILPSSNGDNGVFALKAAATIKKKQYSDIFREDWLIIFRDFACVRPIYARYFFLCIFLIYVRFTCAPSLSLRTIRYRICSYKYCTYCARSQQPPVSIVRLRPSGVFLVVHIAVIVIHGYQSPSSSMPPSSRIIVKYNRKYCIR